MCKGLAISINGQGNVLCKGLKSHDETKKGIDGDAYLDFELILPKWKTPVWDKGDGTCVKVFREKGLLTEEDKPKPEILKALREWISQNEKQILVWFAENAELHGWKSSKGNIDNRGQSSEGNIYNWKQSSKGNIYNGGQSSKGDISNWGQSSEGSIDNGGQSSEGNIYNWKQSSKGIINNGGQSSEGNIYNRGQSAKRIYIRFQEVADKGTTALITEFSNSEQEHHDVTTFVGWLKQKWGMKK